jgi:large subunit ribosomal protein L25
MELGGKTSRVLLRDVQMHPFKQLVLHIDFQRVTAGSKMHVSVPLHFNGADESPAVKLDHCVANFVMTELEVECLPRDLPEFIAVDVSTLTKGGTVHLSSVKLPKGVKAITHGTDDPVLVSAVMVSVVEVTPEGEVAAPETGAAAPEADKE